MPAPENLPAGVVMHTYKIQAEGVKKKVIYHFSDVHLAEQDALSDEAERRNAAEKTLQWETLRNDFAIEHNEPHAQEQQCSLQEHFFNLLAVAAKGDALVMAGDICEHASGANLRTIDRALNGYAVPFVYVCGNHENKPDIPDGCAAAQVKKPVQIIDLGDVAILGLDNAARDITPEQNEHLKTALQWGKPLIIAMHVPIMTEENKAQLEKCGEYFQLNYRGASTQVQQFMNLIKENPDKILAVLAGHLHFMNNSEIVPGVTQYVSSQGTLGNINRYEIGG